MMETTARDTVANRVAWRVLAARTARAATTTRAIDTDRKPRRRGRWSRSPDRPVVAPSAHQLPAAPRCGRTSRFERPPVLGRSAYLGLVTGTRASRPRGAEAVADGRRTDDPGLRDQRPRPRFPISYRSSGVAARAVRGPALARQRGCATVSRASSHQSASTSLDYTKRSGSPPRRGRAAAGGTRRNISRVVVLQIAPPSREDVPEYRQIRAELDARIGRINAASPSRPAAA